MDKECTDLYVEFEEREAKINKINCLLENLKSNDTIITLINDLSKINKLLSIGEIEGQIVCMLLDKDHNNKVTDFIIDDVLNRTLVEIVNIIYKQYSTLYNI